MFQSARPHSARPNPWLPLFRHALWKAAFPAARRPQMVQWGLLVQLALSYLGLLVQADLLVLRVVLPSRLQLPELYQPRHLPLQAPEQFLGIRLLPSLLRTLLLSVLI